MYTQHAFHLAVHRRWLMVRSPRAHSQVWPLAGVAGSLAIFTASSVDRQPDTGRFRLMCVSREHELTLGEESVAAVLKSEGSNELPADDEVSQHVTKVVNKVVAAAVVSTKADVRDVTWRTHVIKSGAKNAFVLPTGDIFVYTGMLELCDNSDQLAFVVAHEVVSVQSHTCRVPPPPPLPLAHTHAYTYPHPPTHQHSSTRHDRHSLHAERNSSPIPTTCCMIVLFFPSQAHVSQSVYIR
jgi:hypothetical protein